MANGYVGGSVSAEVILDTSKFDEGIKKIKTEMEELKSAFKGFKVTDELKEMQQTIKQQQTSINNLRNTIDQLRTKNTELSRSYKELLNNYKTSKSEVNNYTQAQSKLVSESSKVEEVINKQTSSQKKLTETMKLAASRMKEVGLEYRFVNQTLRDLSNVANIANNAMRQISLLNFKENGSGFTQYRTNLAQINAEAKKVGEEFGVNIPSSLQRWSDAQKKVFESGKIGLNTYYKTITQVQTAMNNINFSKMGTGFNQIRTNFRQINAEAKKVGTQYSVNIPSSLQRLSNAHKQTFNNAKINLNTYNQNIKKVQQGLKQYENEIKKVGDYSKTNFTIAGQALQSFDRQLKTTKVNLEQINTASKTGATNIRNFGNSATQTAHSGRILSNTLYQMRGALLSLKMIFTAMGGMALWGFATQIAEGVKETFKARNEMEAQLKQNTHVGEGGIQYFNKALDETTKKFKKINKYSIGETVSSIGLEFDLSAKQMAESMDIVSMVQSEYVRAGRKEEEAALAVKDILQGEFSRLSRETGVGKEELKAYGWNGDKTDVESLMDALRKAAKDRHWDVFAAKATSLNDVMTITKSRFSEFGADLLDSISPMVVGAFNSIIDTIDKAKSSFDKLGTFGKNLTLGGGFYLGITALGTALPMITKGMGLADIATIGWGKSIATAALNLNKNTVAQYGLRKALAEVITGTKASELATMRSSKAIMGRVLGLDAVTLKEKGYLGAMVKSKASLKEGISLLNTSNAYTMSRSQKLAYLTTNMKLNEAAELSSGKAILKTATSWKVLRAAMMATIAVGAIAWYTSITTYADRAKKAIEGYNNVLSNGKTIASDSKKTYEDYKKSLSSLKKGTEEYTRTKKNMDIALGNYKDIQKANKHVKEYDYSLKQLDKSITERRNERLVDSFKLAGKSYEEATELTSNYDYQVLKGYEQKKLAANKYDAELYKASQHINEQLKLMPQTDEYEAQRVKYVQDYNEAAESAANNLKKFYEGDASALMYYAWDRLRMIMVDLGNNESVQRLMKALNDTWKSWQPTLKSICKWLSQLGSWLADIGATLLSNDLVKQGALWTGLGLGIAFAGKKIYNWIGGTKSTIDLLKSLGGRLKKAITSWRNYGKEVEKAKKKEQTPTTTGGTVPTQKAPTTKGELGQLMKQDLFNNVRNFAKLATQIAMGMALLTEAIYLIQAPMWSLAKTGQTFKAKEKSIRAGIEGLSVIAPTIIALLTPMVALMYITDHYNVDWKTMGKGFLTAVAGIAMAITLVTEAILLLNVPLLTLALLGGVYSRLKDNVKQGITAMDILNQSLRMLVPWIPIFVAGMILADAAMSGVGSIALVTVAAGIAVGIGLVTEAILLLGVPLWAIGEIGKSFPDLSNVQQGTEAIKQCAEALKYVESAFGYFAGIQWDLLSGYIAQLIGVHIGVDLTNLTGEGGFFDQLNQFLDDFNKLEIKEIDSTKVDALKDVATGMSTITDAMKAVKEAMANLPEEFKNKTTTITYDQQNNTTTIGQSTDNTGYFDQFKEPLIQLNDFIEEFNNEIKMTPPDTTKLDAINKSAEFITSVNTAITNVKTALGSAVDASWNSNVAQTGLLGAGIGLLVGSGNLGGGSSIKGSLDELYNCIKDIMEFNSRIEGLTGSDGGDGKGVEKASNLVSALQTQINNLKSTLTGAVPEIKSSAKGIGSSIVSGVKEGLSTLSTDVKPTFDTLSSNLKTYGEDAGTKLTDGLKDKIDIKSATQTEIDNTITYLDGKKQEFYDKGYALGDNLSRGYKDGQDMHSPGIIARSTEEELGRIGTYLDTSINNLPQKAYNLAQTMSNNFSSSFNLGDFKLPNLTDFQQGLSSVTSMANETKTNVSNKFTQMKTNIETTFNGIKTNATNNYNQIVSTTRTSLTNMQSQTTKNIGAIRTSWKGMQDALIKSAENIRSQTGSKIDSLKNNMASFWNKIKHPDQLIGSAGGHTGTIRRRSIRSRTQGNYAGGGTVSRSQSLFKPKRSNSEPSDLLNEYLQCLITTGKPCYAGGWDFNWTSKIQKRFTGWKTHFNKYGLDDVLNVGKFNNNKFPVKNNATIAKQYIYDVIRGTTYSKYFNSNFGDNPVAALRAGAFNCWDGTNVVLAIARAFGFDGSRRHGTWNGIGHVWANIPGLGIIDPTAIQQRGSFTSSAVKGYSAGAIPRRGSNGATKTRSDGSDNGRVVNITIDMSGSTNYGIDDLNNRIKEGVKEGLREEFNDPYTVPL